VWPVSVSAGKRKRGRGGGKNKNKMKETVGCGVGRNLRCRRASVEGAAPPKAVLHAACLQTARLLRAPRLSVCLVCSTTRSITSPHTTARRGAGKREEGREKRGKKRVFGRASRRAIFEPFSGLAVALLSDSKCFSFLGLVY
jgi:hypothetical protein